MWYWRPVSGEALQQPVYEVMSGSIVVANHPAILDLSITASSVTTTVQYHTWNIHTILLGLVWLWLGLQFFCLHVRYLSIFFWTDKQAISKVIWRTPANQPIPTAVEIWEWMSNFIHLFGMDLIIYPCPKPDTYLGNLYQLKRYFFTTWVMNCFHI